MSDILAFAKWLGIGAFGVFVIYTIGHYFDRWLVKKRE